MKGRVRVWLLWMGTVVLLFAGRFPAYADEEQAGDPIEGLMDGSLFDWEELDTFLREHTPESSQTVSFTELVKTLLRGDGKAAGRLILNAGKELLYGEISSGGARIGQLFAIGALGAVFTLFSEAFSESAISETGFFMTYLTSFTLLMTTFLESVQLARSVLEQQTEFMRALLPSYFLAVAWAGGTASSIAWYEIFLFLIAGAGWLYVTILVPMIQAYVLLTLTGNLIKEEMLSKCTELLKTVIAWGSRSLIGIVLGFQVIQGMVLPYADALQASGVQKLLQVIPGVGTGVSTVTKMLLGSGVLIKNTMGAAAIVLLILYSLMPMVKLLVLFLLYRMVAAMLEPIADKRLVDSISHVAEGQKMLLGIVVSGIVLFTLAIALICMGTNVTYLA